jgi:enoyl-CoA hydratase
MNVEFRLHETIGTIVLSNPPFNLVRDPCIFDLSTLVQFLAQPELRGVIVRGAGRHFSAGADPAVLAGAGLADPEVADALTRAKGLLDLLSFAPVPVVAMIRGSCLGAGLELALACHFRVASTNASLGFPEADWGIIPGMGGTVATAEVMSRPQAMDLMLSGRSISGAEALEMGLVQRAVPTPELEGETRRFLDHLVRRRPPYLVRAIMEAVHNSRRLSRDEALRAEGELFSQVAQQTRTQRGLAGGQG